ncbi:MAG TPA: SGNH/GDSL hydrolase family protein [Puia sp.]|jgi:lysophospholipase L1-like esterase|nr:SGNH/GDSL hydrolase family protein [Puia sp.]
MKRSIPLSVIVLLLTSFAHRPLNWVAIGDSITYLNDHPDETRNRVSKGYLTDVADRLPYLHYSNQGRNGWTIQRFAAKIDSLDIPAGDIFTVFLGTNDWWRGVPIGSWDDYQRGTGDSTVYGSFRILMTKLRSLNSAAPVVLITPMPRADFVYINNFRNNAWGSYKAKQGQTLEKVADAVMDIARHENLRCVDLYHDRRLAIPRLVRYKRLKDPQTGAYREYPYPAYTSIPFDPAMDEYPYPEAAMEMTFDGLHPSDRGNAEIARKLMKVLKRVSN